MPERPPAPIGRRIDARRAELGLTLRELADASGISVQQLRVIRYGQEESPRGLTRAAIERALQWEPGSFDAILDTDADPVPLPPGSAPARTRDDGHTATIAAIRTVYSGDEEGDEAAIIAAIKRSYPGDPVAAAIMGQEHKPLELRWAELRGWLQMDAGAQPLRKSLGTRDNEQAKIPPIR